ncbi:MAG: hypothetical protein GY832_44480, partial [Chloroflexi bacterium]|nr:hypothetical protein [Chloroflexota bacterium]
FVAWGIACLWQLSQWGIPYPDYEGLQAWLTRKNQAEQLIARKHTKTGDEVIQHLMF